MPDDIIPTAEAADILGCSVPTILRLVADGKLEVVAQARGITGARFYQRSDVLALVAAKRADLEARLATMNDPEPAA